MLSFLCGFDFQLLISEIVGVIIFLTPGGEADDVVRKQPTDEHDSHRP